MPRLAYLLAASHSGSTLTAMLLGAHPSACTVGELKATHLGDAERYRCSCGEPIRACAFWAEVEQRMVERGFAFDITDARTDIRGCDSAYVRRLLRPLHRGRVLEAVRDAALWISPTWRAHLPAIQARNAALIEAVCQTTDSDVIVDSSKIATRLKYLLRNPSLDVRVIRLIRDGRGVALAYIDPERFADAASEELRGGGMGLDRDDERLTTVQAAHEWRRSNEEAEQLLAGLDPSRWTEVRYEDLCTEPDAALDRLFGFLEVDPGRAVRDFRSVAHHVVGNGMRLDSTSEIRLDERWKSVLTEGDLAAFDSVAGDLNRRYGYV